MSQPETRHGAEAARGARAWLGSEVLALLLLAACVAELLREAWALPPHLDDAYISYRYARNLVGGLGLVYNPGEYVEGFTNLLWTLLVAAGLALGVEAKLASHALGLAAGVAALVATFGYARAGLARERAWAAAAAPALVLASIAFARWTSSGMETPLVVAATTAALWAQAARRIGWATFALCIATLTRPDAALVAAVVFAFELSRARREGLRALAGPAVWATLLVLLTLFRVFYYGDALPNTFYAKVGGVPLDLGVRYLLAFLSDGAGFLLLPAAWAAWRVPALRPGAALVVVQFGYVVGIGGDVFGHGRFLLPVLPALAVLAVRGSLLLFDSRRALGVAAAACAAAAACVMVWGGIPGPSDLRESKRAQAVRLEQRRDAFWEKGCHKELARLDSRGEPVRLIAASGIGCLGYHSRYRVLDLVGLVDPTIARSRPPPEGHFAVPGHLRSNADYVLGQSPDYIFIPKKGSSLRLLLNTYLDLWEHPELERSYDWDEELRAYRRRALDHSM